jgi:hypothetical protein
MPMNEPQKDDTQERFEQQLRGFRPVAPHKLAIPNRRAHWGVLAVAAAVLVIVVVPWTLKRYSQTDKTAVARTPRTGGKRNSLVVPITLGRLNAALRASDQDFNQMLDDTNPRLLPHTHPGTALFELGKE